MKTKFILLIVLVSYHFATSAQTSGSTLYKADHWADTKGKGSFERAMENPTYEKVEILKTAKNFKVTFGKKIYNYEIKSSHPFSEMRMDYNVLLNGYNYTLAICIMPDGKTVVGIEGVWMVPDIQSIINNK